MKQMRQFLTTLSVVWIAACIAAYLYSHQQHISSSVALAVIPAFLVEFVFYLAPGFPAVREKFDALGSAPLRASLLSASGLLPYLMVSLRTGSFGAIHFLELAAAVLIATFLYVWIPRGLLADLVFLAFMAAVYLNRPFDRVYGTPAPHVALGILGQLMWIRLGLMAVLSLRQPLLDDARLGFLPSLQDWRVGVQHYFYFLPVGAALGYLERFARFHPLPIAWWKFPLLLVATFAAILWVVALAEEFFFRAFLQQVLARRLHSETLGLLAASVLFGLAHLPFRKFPNWRVAIIAAVLGLFCGLALIKARSVKASMVTHALVVTTWRMFFAA
jgi:membrane protease YdiL (CAAX protease family)